MNFHDAFFTQGGQKNICLMFPSQRFPLRRAMTNEGYFDATEPY